MCLRLTAIMPTLLLLASGVAKNEDEPFHWPKSEEPEQQSEDPKITSVKARGAPSFEWGFHICSDRLAKAVLL